MYEIIDLWSLMQKSDIISSITEAIKDGCDETFKVTQKREK